VKLASGPGPEAKRGPASVDFDWDYLFAVQNDNRKRGDEWLLAGTWHTHPRTRIPQTEPSEKDLTVQDNIARAFGWHEFPLVLVTADAVRGWIAPKLHGWLGRISLEDDFTCEPAAIVPP
jgi:hypothetical protein